MYMHHNCQEQQKPRQNQQYVDQSLNSGKEAPNYWLLSVIRESKRKQGHRRHTFGHQLLPTSSILNVSFMASFKRLQVLFIWHWNNLTVYNDLIFNFLSKKNNNNNLPDQFQQTVWNVDIRRNLMLLNTYYIVYQFIH